jgi:hypothetical protein
LFIKIGVLWDDDIREGKSGGLDIFICGKMSYLLMDEFL